MTDSSSDRASGSTSETLVVRTAFGLEAIVARELTALGEYDITTEDGRLFLAGTERDVLRLNLWLRSAERVQIVVGRFPASDFGELFDRTNILPWAAWVPPDGNVPVTARSVRSKLRSLPNLQKIVKKSIVESLRRDHEVQVLPETGAKFPVEVSVVKDDVLLTLDTTGPGLHKRGYRSFIAKAPLKETLAAALVQLSFWNPQRAFWDPVCGSGTLPIEAALIATGRAPGLSREFLCESWPRFATDTLAEIRAEAEAKIITDDIAPIIGTDHDGRILARARDHAKAAGVFDQIHFQEMPLSQVTSSRDYGCMISNPPYGERIGEAKEVEQLYREFGDLFRRLESWSFGVITSHPGFERLAGRRATRKRKLYNGRIRCDYYQFNGPRPPAGHPSRRQTPTEAEQTDSATGTDPVSQPSSQEAPQ